MTIHCNHRPQPIKWLAILGALTAISITSCSRGPQKQTAAAPPPEVATVIVTPQKVLLTTELPGRTSPFRIAEIRPQVSGLIQKRLFTEGAEVKVGDELYQIDPAPFQAALENAQAALARTEASLPALRSRANRLKDALAEKAVSQQDFDDADAAIKQAEADALFARASLETARINLAYARIVSPIQGRIGKSTVTDGAIVTAYQPTALAVIQQLDPIYVDVPQSTSDALRLRQRMEGGHLNKDGTDHNVVQLLLEDGTRYSSEGTLQFRDISVDPTTGSVILRAMFPNPDGVLLPGMFVRAVIKEGLNPQAILIPQQSVSRDPKGNPLALVVDAAGKVEQRGITLERAVGTQWLVSSGLNPGEQIIVEGSQKVRPGMTVNTVPFEAAGKPADAVQPAPTNK